MRKSVFCICENKDADQLRGNCEADQRLCFHCTDSTIPSSLIRNFKALAISCCCTARFVRGLVGNPKDRFSQKEAQMKCLYCIYPSNGQVFFVQFVMFNLLFY